MASELDVVNEALVLLGVPPLASLYDETAQSLVAVSLFESTRKEALADHPWNFAVRESAIPQLVFFAGSPERRSSEFEYAYQLPVNILRAVGLTSTARFIVSGHHLYTNDKHPRLVYIEDVSVGAWSPHFYKYITYQLASAFSISLTDSAEKASFFSGLALRELVKARAVDAQQSSPFVYNLMRIYIKQSYNPLVAP